MNNLGNIGLALGIAWGLFLDWLSWRSSVKAAEDQGLPKPRWQWERALRATLNGGGAGGGLGQIIGIGLAVGQ